MSALCFRVCSAAKSSFSVKEDETKVEGGEHSLCVCVVFPVSNFYSDPRFSSLWLRRILSDVAFSSFLR
jgi:hypothetical protein